MKTGDEVAIALRNISPSEQLAGFPFAAATTVPFGHKIALVDLAPGQIIHRLGQPIGHATAAIPAGSHVHLHNMGFDRSMATRVIGTRLSNSVADLASEAPSFQGYLREDGKVGTRNYIGILTSVNCSALVARMIADHFRDPARLASFAGIDGVVALTHKSGCSVAEGSRSMGMLRRTLAGYARHPNFSGVLLVGLGCEDNQIDQLIADENLTLGPCLRKLVMQETGGTRASVQRGIGDVEAMLEIAAKARRQPVR